MLLSTLNMPISLFYLNSKSFSISAFIYYACLCICIMKFNSKYCIYLCIFFAVFCSWVLFSPAYDTVYGLPLSDLWQFIVFKLKYEKGNLYFFQISSH